MTIDRPHLDLTVVIPHFNHGTLIGRAVASVLSQSALPQRILIVDDASTDGSFDVLHRLEAEPPIVEVIQHEERLGVNGNANKGLALCRTEYVTFMGADDIMNPGLYETAVGCLNDASEANACCTDSKWIDEDGNTLPQPASVTVLTQPGYVSPARVFKLMEYYGPFLVGGGCVFRTIPFQQEGGLSADLGPYADSYVLQRMAAKSGVCYIPQRLYTWQRSTKGYAISTAANAASLAALYETVKSRMATEDEGLFPDSFMQRHDARWRFDVTRAAIQASPRALDIASRMAPRGPSGWLFNIAAAFLPRRIAIQAAFILLRPADLIFAIRRRLTEQALI